MIILIFFEHIMPVFLAADCTAMLVCKTFRKEEQNWIILNLSYEETLSVCEGTEASFQILVVNNKLFPHIANENNSAVVCTNN